MTTEQEYKKCMIALYLQLPSEVAKSVMDITDKYAKEQFEQGREEGYQYGLEEGRKQGYNSK